MNPEIKERVDKDSVRHVFRELIYIAVTVNQRIVRSLPKTQDREEALRYLMKCSANKMKWANRLAKELDNEITEE